MSDEISEAYSAALRRLKTQSSVTSRQVAKDAGIGEGAARYRLSKLVKMEKLIVLPVKFTYKLP